MFYTLINNSFDTKKKRNEKDKIEWNENKQICTCGTGIQENMHNFICMSFFLLTKGSFCKVA